MRPKVGNKNTSYLKEGGEGDPANPGNSRRVTITQLGPCITYATHTRQQDIKTTNFRQRLPTKQTQNIINTWPRPAMTHGSDLPDPYSRSLLQVPAQRWCGCQSYPAPALQWGKGRGRGDTLTSTCPWWLTAKQFPSYFMSAKHMQLTLIYWYQYSGVYFTELQSQSMITQYTREKVLPGPCLLKKCGGLDWLKE